MSVVVDSSVLIAYRNESDERHAKALELFKQIEKGEYGSPLLIDYVFDETLTYIFSKRGKARSLAVGNWLLSSDFDLDYATSVIFQEAWFIFQKSSELSFTDCVIVAFAREKNASIATFDGHFSQFKDLRIVG